MKVPWFIAPNCFLSILDLEFVEVDKETWSWQPCVILVPHWPDQLFNTKKNLLFSFKAREKCENEAKVGRLLISQNPVDSLLAISEILYPRFIYLFLSFSPFLILSPSSYNFSQSSWIPSYCRQEGDIWKRLHSFSRVQNKCFHSVSWQARVKVALKKCWVLGFFSDLFCQ